MTGYLEASSVLHLPLTDAILQKRGKSKNVCTLIHQFEEAVFKTVFCRCFNRNKKMKTCCGPFPPVKKRMFTRIAKKIF